MDRRVYIYKNLLNMRHFYNLKMNELHILKQCVMFTDIIFAKYLREYLYAINLAHVDAYSFNSIRSHRFINYTIRLKYVPGAFCILEDLSKSTADILYFFKNIRIYTDDFTMLTLSMYGQLNSLKYLYETTDHSTKWCMLYAAQRGHLEVCKWLDENTSVNCINILKYHAISPVIEWLNSEKMIYVDLRSLVQHAYNH